MACGIGVGGDIDSVSSAGGFGDIAMRIIAYVITTGMDVDTLPDALNSLAYFSDHIYVTDGLQGPGTLKHVPLHTAPIREWLLMRSEYESGDCISCRKWNGVPFTLMEREFDNPAAQRNWTLGRLSELDPRADWVVWIDSDEVCSWEMIHGIRDLLERVPRNVSDVCQQWLNLVRDEQHCVGGHHSSWLSHSKIHRLGAVHWANEWHEHGVFNGDRVRWNTRVIHTRSMFRRILLVQRGHPVIGNRRSRVLPEAPMFWDDLTVESIPNGATWPALHYPEGEIIPFPVDKDAAEVWDHSTGERIGDI